MKACGCMHVLRSLPCSCMYGLLKTAERILPSKELAAVCTKFHRQLDKSLADAQGSSSLQGVAA